MFFNISKHILMLEDRLHFHMWPAHFMWFESVLVYILFKFPNISRIRVVFKSHI